MSALVYAYGCGRPIEGMAYLDAEQERCVDLWDALVLIDHTLDARIRAAAAEDDPELARITEQIGILTARLRADAKDGETRAQRRTLFAEQRKRLNAWRKAHKDVVRECEVWRQEQVKLARQHSTCWWGNYLRVLRSYETGRQVARQKGRLLRYYDAERDDGVMAVQIQRTPSGLGAAPSELMDGTVPNLQIGLTCQRGRRSRLMQMRVDCEGHLITVPIWWHRDLPEGCRVKGAQLVWHRRGSRLRYQLCLTLSLPERRLRPILAPVGLSLIWNEGLTVLRATDGRTWALSQEWGRRQALIALRQAALDAALEDGRARWQLVESSYLALFQRLQLRWHALPADQREWYRYTRRIWNELTRLRASVLASRREQYRLIAREVVRAYATIELPAEDLSIIARDERGEQRNSLRHALGLHTLRAEILHQATKIDLPVLASGRVLNAPRDAGSNAWARAKRAKVERSRIPAQAIESGAA